MTGDIMKKEIWWKKYDSYTLCAYHHKQFDSWWDPDKFNWVIGSGNLVRCCENNFDKWWDPDKFDWRYYAGIALRCASSKFSDTQLKQLLLHSNENARKFAMDELIRRKNGKR